MNIVASPSQAISPTSAASYGGNTDLLIGSITTNNRHQQQINSSMANDGSTSSSPSSSPYNSHNQNIMIKSELMDDMPTYTTLSNMNNHNPVQNGHYQANMNHHHSHLMPLGSGNEHHVKSPSSSSANSSTTNPSSSTSSSSQADNRKRSPNGNSSTASKSSYNKMNGNDHSTKNGHHNHHHHQSSSSESNKKTKGRVKIKMEFIDNKLRRYTTFSKRKTGIMKKVSVFVCSLACLPFPFDGEPSSPFWLAQAPHRPHTPKSIHALGVHPFISHIRILPK